MSEIKQHWQKIELNEILSISSKKFNPISNNENKKCVELEHLSQETGKLLGYTNSSEQQSIKNSFEEGQILFGKLRPYLKKFWKAEFEGVCSSEIWVMSGKKVKNDFLFYLVQIEKFNQIANVSSGSKMPRADWNYMSEIPFDVPPLKEQEKIAEILTTWDEAITKQTELLEAKELLKIALMQKLLSGEVRFGGFNDEWKEVAVSDFMIERNIQTPKSNEYPLMAFVAYKGVTDKGDRYDREFLVADEDNKKYKQTEYGDFIYSSNNLETGSIGLNRYGSATISPVYSIFQITKSCDYKFISNFFTTKRFINSMVRFRQGVMYGQWRIHESDFLKIKVNMPTLPEQQKIAEVLSLADDEINLLKNSLVELKLQKKALMQKLLTGQVRVKV